MNEDGISRSRITAGELLDKLESDPAYRARQEALELQMQANVHDFRSAERPIIQELQKIGCPITSVEEFRELRHSYRSSVPVLVKWLHKIEHPSVKRSVVRALTVPWARPLAALPLVREFKQAPEFSESDFAWVVGNALSVVADDSVFEEIVSLAKDKRYGRSREMLAVALGNMKSARAVGVLIELLDDDEVAGHAIIALGKLKAHSARSQIEKFLSHPKSWIRAEAKRALAKIDKAVNAK